MGDEDTGVREALENAVDTMVPDPQESTVEVQAPDTWEQTDKDVFSSIQDHKARQWLLDRDKGYNDRISQFETRYKGFDELFEPYADRLKQSNQQPVDVIKNLLTAQSALETNPIEAFKYLGKMYNFDFKQLVEAAQPDANAPDPSQAWREDLDPGMRAFLENMEKTLGSFKTQQEAEQARQVHETQQKLTTAATEFREAKDEQGQPLNPHMANKEVVDMMAALISSGQVRVVNGDVKAAYKEAYDRAIYAVPAVRDQVLKAEAEKRQAEQDKITKERLNKARRAGVGVRGVGTSEASRPAGGSVRELLQGQMQEAGLFGN